MIKTALLLVLCALGAVQTYAQNPPSVKFFVGDSVVNEKEGVPKSDLQKLKIRVVPDSEFAAAHPNDVYTITNWRLYLRNGSRLSTPATGSGEDLHFVWSSVQKGDVISIEIGNVIRTDAAGKREKIPLSAGMKYVSIPVK